MEFVEIVFASEQYQQSLVLRQDILRAPLGLVLSEHDLHGENRQRHFGLVTPESQLIACVVIKPVDTMTVRLRQMAVMMDFQGQGLGRGLVISVERQLKHDNIKHIELHARVVAQEFYAALGYHLTGEPFMEIGIPHVAMYKDI
jgi:predicted GNAT family N-acyltransferase